MTASVHKISIGSVPVGVGTVLGRYRLLERIGARVLQLPRAGSPEVRPRRRERVLPPTFGHGKILLLALVFGIGCRTNGPVIGQTAGISTEVTLEVVSKRAPETLIARDGSTCRVAPDVYASTRVGSMFRCRWYRN